AGAQGIQVVRDDRTAPATIVAFDPEMDLAYLSTDLPGRPIPLSTSRTESGDQGVAYVVRDGRVVALDVAVRRRVNIRTQDVYLQGSTLRPGFDLDGMVRTGDSGGAVVVDGRVIGVIWARSTRDETRAYAIDPVAGGTLVRSQLRSGSLGDDVDVARCH
ncbi:MAG: trypsin-like peptidase domain-containing protein, partial [Ilumatobacteraceae bacterium]